MHLKPLRHRRARIAAQAAAATLLGGFLACLSGLVEGRVAYAQAGRNAPPATVPLTEVTPLTEIPRGKPVLIQGTISAAHETMLVLNDGNAAIIVQLGKTWRDLTGAKVGDRIRAIGQIDPYGTGLFRAGSLVLPDGRVIVIP